MFLGLGGDGRLKEVVEGKSAIVECAPLCLVREVDPCFGRVDEVQVHIAGHWVRFVPNAGGLIVEVVILGDFYDRFDLDYSHKYDHRSSWLE